MAQNKNTNSHISTTIGISNIWYTQWDSNPPLLDSELGYLSIYLFCSYMAILLSLLYILLFLIFSFFCSIGCSYGCSSTKCPYFLACLIIFLLFIYLLLYKKINLINLISLKACNISINSQLYLCYFILTKVKTYLTIANELLNSFI